MTTAIYYPVTTSDLLYTRDSFYHTLTTLALQAERVDICTYTFNPLSGIVDEFLQALPLRSRILIGLRGQTDSKTLRAHAKGLKGIFIRYNPDVHAKFFLFHSKKGKERLPAVLGSANLNGSLSINVSIVLMHHQPELLHIFNNAWTEGKRL